MLLAIDYGNLKILQHVLSPRKLNTDFSLKSEQAFSIILLEDTGRGKQKLCKV